MTPPLASFRPRQRGSTSPPPQEPTADGSRYDFAPGRAQMSADLILVEVLQGFRNDRDHARACQLLGAIPLIEMLGRSTAHKAAENHRTLRRHGVTLRKTIDAIIAKACIASNLPLLFSDRDLTPFVTHLGGVVDDHTRLTQRRIAAGGRPEQGADVLRAAG